MVFSVAREVLDSRLRGNDDFLRSHRQGSEFPDPPMWERGDRNPCPFMKKSIGRSQEGCQAKTEAVIQKPLDMF